MTKYELINFEDVIVELWEKGEINASVHLSGGNEEQLIKLFKQISPQDYVFSTWRNHYHYLLHTGRWSVLMDEICNRGHRLCGGMSRSMHTIDRSHNFFSSAIVAGCCSIAVGVAYALKSKESKQKVWCFIGDGGCDSGLFYESWRYAVAQDLPVTFVVEDNDRSVDASVKERWGDKDRVMETLRKSDKIYYYRYTAKYPHVGSGVHVQFT